MGARHFSLYFFVGVLVIVKILCWNLWLLCFLDFEVMVYTVSVGFVVGSMFWRIWWV